MAATKTVFDREIAEVGFSDRNAFYEWEGEEFRAYDLSLGRLYRGTSRVGWYVTGIRGSDVGAFNGRLRVNLSDAVDDPAGARKEWVRRAEADGAHLDSIDETIKEE